VRRLADELAEARAEQAELRQRMAALEMIAAAAAPQDLPAPVPPALAAAARDLRATEVPVRLDVAGAEAIAVIGGAGDPQQWWAAIWRLAGAGRGPHVIRVRHEALPPGLSALVRRRPDGGLDVIVSTALSAHRRRAAVRLALRAIQHAGRRTGVLPVPALILLALSGTWLRAIGRLMRLRPAATIAVATTASVAVVAIAVVPHMHGPAVAGPNPAGVASSPHPQSTAGQVARGGPTPSAPAATQPQPSAIPAAVHSPAGAAASTSVPQQTLTEPAPTPSPAPSPSASAVLTNGAAAAAGRGARGSSVCD